MAGKVKIYLYKEGIFVILDVAQSMGKPYDENITRLQFGIESARHLIRQKV
jgi:hypothetical protein